MSFLQGNQANRRILTDGDVIADLQEVPPSPQEVDAAMDVHAPPDPGAERPQHHALQFRPCDESPWNELDDALH